MFKRKIFLTLLFLSLLPATILGVKKVIDWRKGARGKWANIFVDASQPGAPIHQRLWQNFAQGGEEAKDMLAPVIDQIKPLRPQLIRIDHIFDFYQVVQPGGGYDFSRLDQAVRSILATGATPMLSLSYTPSSFTADGKITSPPKNWTQWEDLIQATVEHYSGRQGFNINNVYYEVWNEPDLFGRWHYRKEPNYLTLYYHTVKGALKAKNTRPFKIGGPAVTGFYPNWIKALFEFANRNNLPVDFVSWHRYSQRLDDYDRDFEKLNQILTNYPRYFTVERIITEFGPDSEPSFWYSNRVGAAHAIAVSLRLLDKVHRVFAFEIKDGPSREEKKDSHQWGIITHETKGKKPKPRWHAYRFLNQLSGQRLPLKGEGSWVSAVAAKRDKQIKILLVNYDPHQQHQELVPLRVNHLPPGRYRLFLDYLFGRDSSLLWQGQEGFFFHQVLLPPNEAVLVTLAPL